MGVWRCGSASLLGIGKLISAMARNGRHISSDNPPENIVWLPPVSPVIACKLLSSGALGLRFQAQV